MNVQGLILFLRKHPIGVGCAGLAVILLGLTFSRAGTLDTLQTEVQDLEDRSGRLKNNLRYSAGLEQHLAALDAAMAVVEEKAITPGALATNLQFFYRLEQELGLTLVDLQQGVVQQSKEPRAYLEVPYTVAVEGTYRQLLELLQKLEEGGRLVKFVTVNLSPARGLQSQRADPTNPRLVLTLELALLGHSSS